ncbi:unnamed protein product (mitochondrion) [Plasmodiophora brassicae]|uniref:CobW/HypB/UreG nucleotide-binding domain-containing protein n=1 Tax=Plasmodiophora brassicae TaxID=37360 RepID=A0A3P3YF28_PLABS|nr:unnamed protein product [Plasmodiophora brassicae]
MRERTSCTLPARSLTRTILLRIDNKDVLPFEVIADIVCQTRQLQKAVDSSQGFAYGGGLRRTARLSAMTSGGAVDGSVPLTVVGGWLGSGKTTLVNAMMSMLAEQGHRVALIQNEFSEAGMDPTVTDADSGQVFDNLIELAKGCVCCTVKSDLLGALQKLVDLNRFTYYILECSGLADPGRIASIFWVDEELEIPIHLDAILTVVDAAHCLDQLSASEGHCLERQIAERHFSSASQRST